MIAASLWAVVMSVYDIRHRLLPNWLTLGGAVAALAVRIWGQGIPGLVEGVAAGTVAGVFLLLPFLMRGAGGGDVKMLFAAGIMAGWGRLIPLLWFMSLSGLALAVVMLVGNRADGARLKHYARSLLDWRYDRKAGAEALPPKESARVRVPFGVAISAGLILALWTTP